MTAITVLPPNATPFEQRAAQAMAQIERVPVAITDPQYPDTCPVNFLPHLAWEFSVDRWDEKWPEATKRAVIRNSFFVHRRKGTIGALRRAVEPLGYLIDVIEWWQHVPAEEPGTFRLRIGVLETGITDAMYAELQRLIDDAKPLTRHLIGLDIILVTTGAYYLGVGVYQGEELTVYPYTPDVISVSGAMGMAGTSHIIETLTVYP